MLSFPVQLPHVTYSATRIRPVVESASRLACVARAKYTPKNISYEARILLENGEWKVTVDGWDNYPVAAAGEVALGVINWWFKTFWMAETSSLPPEVASPRALWLTRAAHKLLTEVGEHSDQIAALQILASNYQLALSLNGTGANIKGAAWATAANRHLEKDIPEPERRRAVALLIDVVMGIKVA